MDVVSGTDDAPVVVGACNGLAPSGTWEEISPVMGNTTPTGVPGEGTKWGAASVAVHPTESGTLYAGVTHKGIWKSIDCGSTWTKTNVGTHGDWLDTGIQFALRLAVGVSDTLYVDNFQGNPLTFLKSIDSGKAWEQLYSSTSNVANNVQLGGYGNDISIDPEDVNHLLITFHATCNTPNAACVGESTNAGMTWTLWPGPPLDGWQEHARPYFISRNAWLYAAHSGLWFTSGIAASATPWEQVGRSGGAGGFYKAASGQYFLGSDSGVLRSSDGHVWNLIPGSPPATSVVCSGAALYAGYMFAKGAGVVWSAPEDNPTSWTQMATPVMGTNGGPWHLGYDPGHHLLFSADHLSGLWRTVVP